ncbi:hypothetical protein Q8A67_012128 [Cirrhinus molitorella]|uniref:Uncharacterized protein n=1 Tax=Cirrhinus molitorella TaxID=172907 RepID=A0AA88PVR2_9TELE|nr:hypothetical protein Q8A67_012128 [Cirrhinus molitorella]
MDLSQLADWIRQVQSQDTTNTNAVLRAKAKGFLNIAKDGVVLRFCCFLHDTIYQLSNLSKSLQRSVSTLAEAQSCLSSTQAVIEKYKSRPGPKLRSVLDTDTYEGVLLKPSDAGQSTMASKRVKRRGGKKLDEETVESPKNDLQAAKDTRSASC